jgi:vancomycin permeability regulator SanA
MYLLCAVIIAVAGLHDDIGHADVALVLGSKVEADGGPSPRLRARLDKAVELYRAGCFPEIIASGGIGKEGYDEAVVMKAYLVAHGIPTERVIVDNSGATTFASARKTRQILRDEKLSSVLVISQYFHIPRARLALGRFGIATVYTAHANLFEWRDVYSSLREVPGWLEYWFRRTD